MALTGKQETEALKRRQRNRLYTSFFGILLGLVLAFIIIFGGYIYIPLPMPYLPTLHDRLVFALRWQLVPLGCLVLSIISQTYRNLIYEDPYVPSSYSINFEHVVLSSLSHLSFCTYVEESAMKFIPLSAGLFVLGSLFARNTTSTFNLFRRTCGATMMLFIPCAATFYSLFCLFWRGAGLKLGRPPIY